MERTPASQSEEGPLLVVRGLTKRFTATLALDRVDFDVRRGEVHALLGQNGAGKSTLIKILAGVYDADEGEIAFGAKVLQRGHRLPGVSFIHQDLGLVDWMSVAENVAIQTGYPRLPFGLISWRRAREAAAVALAGIGVDIDPERPVSSLPAAERSLVAIGRALAVQSDILVLDEPTAALPEHDVERLLEALRRLRANGIGVVYVTHRLDEVFRIADRVTVLRDGRKIATVAARETSSDALVQMIVGRSLTDAFARPEPATARAVLSVQSAVVGAVGPVSFEVAAGETLGLVGLRGAGHHAVGRAIFGEPPLDSGALVLDGAPIAPKSAAEAMALGVGFVSSRRADESIAANLSVRENIFMNPVLTGRGVLQFVPRRTEANAVQAALRRFAIKAEGPEQPVATLSGGNQQKVVVTRWMEGRVKLLILEEPTIGVDVGSKAEIYRLLRTSLSEGMAALAISSDFEEVERVCHRALVFSRGRVVAEIQGESLTIERLTEAASGGSVTAEVGAAP
jgi:ribose transport system ATP-binding protein